MSEMKPQAVQGIGLIRFGRTATAVFVLTAVAGVADPQGLAGPLVAVSIALFAVGIVTMLMAFARAVERSRSRAIGIGGLYFAAGSAPARVRRELLGLLAVQVAVGLAAAGLRVFTAVAFATLVPVFGIGMTGLWCARYGVFEPRSDSPLPSGPRDQKPGKPRSDSPGERLGRQRDEMPGDER